MSKWEDKEAWAGLVDGSTCPICQGIQKQGKPLWVLLEMQASWVTAPPTAPLPGYVCLVCKRHVVEPYQPPAAEQQMWWQEVMVAAEAITELLGSPKMNYEIHGNTIPHLVGQNDNQSLSGCPRGQEVRVERLAEVGGTNHKVEHACSETVGRTRQPLDRQQLNFLRPHRRA